VCLETATQDCSARVPDPHPGDDGSGLKHLASCAHEAQRASRST
jgi:hypothetical protein